MSSKKKQASTGKIAIVSLILLVIAFVVSSVAFVYINTPQSYEIPTTVVAQTHTSSSTDIEVETITSQDLSIHFLELGNKYTGDCTLIKVGNTEVLVDAGSRADSVSTIKSYVDNYCTDGVLEYVIVTHAHQDHYAGFATSANVNSILDLYSVKNIIEFAQTNQKSTSTLYSNYTREKQESIARNETNVYTALECYNNENGASRSISLGSNVSIDILYQKYYETKASTENDYSVCFELNQNNDKYYLFTGDLEKGGEESLVESNTLHEVEVYKAGHHGSKTSSSDTLLSVIKPKTVCVCCCAGSSEYTSNNSNQFPTQEFIDRISPYTANVYVTTLSIDYSKGEFTSMNGCIIITSKNLETGHNVYCTNNTTVLKDTEWFKANRTTPTSWTA